MSGITTVNGGTVPNNFTMGNGNAFFLNGFNLGTTVASIDGNGAYTVGGSSGYPSTVALSAANLAVTVTGATTIAFGGESDTVTAAGTTPYTALLGGNSVLNEGAGPSTVYAGNGADTVNAGSGATTVFGSPGSLTFSGGSSSNDYILAGSGENTLNGGSGGSNTLIGGAGGTQINLTGASTGDHVVGGTGVTFVDASQTTGNFEIDTTPTDNPNSFMVAQLGSGADTFVGGGGTSFVQAGSGADVFGFVKGAAGGTEYIYGFNAKDNIAFDNYGTGYVPTEQVVNGSDVISLSDGTTIHLVGYSEKLF